MATDLIIGVVDNYNWDQIKYWANSIKQSGFKGHKAIIAYNMGIETVNKLTEEGFLIVGCNVLDKEKGFSYDLEGRSIMVDRFMNIYQLLDQLEEGNEVERVFITDVRDVVFQENPSEWLNKHISPHAKIIVGSENFRYNDEPWSNNNMAHAFGYYFLEKMKNRPIYCAGVIAGEMADIRDFCLNLWLVCRGLNPHVQGGGGPDQAALNILLSNDIYKNKTFFLEPVSGFILHAGTSMPAIKAGSGGIGETYNRDPKFKINFIKDLDIEMKNDIVTVNGKNVCILHQWDRVPEWKKALEKKYGE